MNNHRRAIPFLNMIRDLKVNKNLFLELPLKI